MGRVGKNNRKRIRCSHPGLQKVDKKTQAVFTIRNIPSRESGFAANPTDYSLRHARRNPRF